MSKVVTIPKDRNPFIVIVNGVEYKYPAGATIEVPDSVADVIEKYEGAKPKPDPTPTPGGSGGSVQSDWNQTDSSAADFIKNKPFGDMPTGGDTLYWDGNTEGLVCVEDMFYKVSDNVPTMDDLANGAIISATDGIREEIPMDDIIDYRSEGIPVIFVGYLMLIALEDNITNFDFPLPEKGIYFGAGNGIYVELFTIPGYTGFPVTNKIEEKYLPGAVILYADAENYLYATADTSDTSKRMTRAELLGVLRSGRIVYGNSFGVYLTMVIAADMIEYASVMFATATSDGVFGQTACYTAEYVPET